MASVSAEVSTTSGPISSSTFSTSSVLPSSTSATSIPTQTNDNNDDGMPAISRSSSLLFGFLITFLALFIGFMACGYSSRRAAQIRGARYAAQLRGAEYHAAAKMKKPRLWDVRIDERSGRNRWRTITPLSASLVHPAGKEKHPIQPPEPDPDTPPALREDVPPQEYPPSFYFGSRLFGRLSFPAPSPPRRHPSRAPDPTMAYFVLPTSSLMLPSSSAFSTRSQNRAHNKATEGSSAPRKNVDWDTKDVNAQVSVLIAMPSPASSSSRCTAGKSRTNPIDDDVGITEESRDGLPYYEIGVAKVPISRSTEQKEERLDGQQG